MDCALVSKLLKVPLVSVETNWPKIKTCLDSLGCGSERNYIAALATLRVECPSFQPVSELGGNQYFLEHYENRKDLGNTQAGDGPRFHGRGFVQITGRANYERYGQLLSLNLRTNPDLALDPDVAASIFAAFWCERKVNIAAEAQEWDRVRRLVNGGTNGLIPFLQYVSLLQHASTTLALDA